jgi:putative membrane protein
MPCAVPDAPASCSISIPVTVAALTAAFVYLRGWSRLRRASDQAPSARKLIAFLGGTLALWIAVGTPLATLDHARLTFHMLQHLLLMTIAAPLILLGEPATPLRCGLPKSVVERVVNPILCRLHGVGTILTHPACCWLAGTAVVIAWHVPAVFELGMHSPFWHAVQHASFLVGGLLFWWPVIQRSAATARWPRWSLPLYLFLATLPCDALSAFLTFCGRVVYSAHGAAANDALRLQDQELAGALMWSWVTFAYVIPAIRITIQILAPAPRDTAIKTIEGNVRLRLSKPGRRTIGFEFRRGH